MDSINKFKSLGIILGLILMVLGVVFLVFSDEVVKIIGVLIGAGVIVIGGIRIIQGLMTKPENGNKWFKIIPGIIMAVVGLYLLLDSETSIQLVGIIIGIFAFAAAFDRFLVAVERGKNGLRWGNTVLFGIIHIIFGIIMIYFAITAFSVIIMLTGIYLLAAGIMVILSSGYFFDFK